MSDDPHFMGSMKASFDPEVFSQVLKSTIDTPHYNNYRITRWVDNYGCAWTVEGRGYLSGFQIGEHEHSAQVTVHVTRKIPLTVAWW